VTSPTDTQTLARAERADLAELLATLTPEQWQAPTLCARWRVRDVVAHMFSYEDLSLPAVLGQLVRGGFNLDRVNEAGVAAYADHTPEQLVARVKAHLDPSGLTAKFGGRIALTDGLIHHQDIRRSLGLHRRIPPERMLTVLDFARTARPIGAAKRIHGLTLRATELDWTTGTGPVVEGPSEPLLLAMAGRRGVIDELSGPGQQTLAKRLRT
jgi:uncharacterized protein (TIGR03083 family)